ncbi:hypothetical protein Ddc_16733 [Ditylenchus destructor]|nr:hypothetical protein Ddc_16733 [Ditylenchus destructor]
MNAIRHHVPEALGGNKCKDHQFECVYCDPNMEMYFTTTREAMIRHCRSAHNVEEQIAKRHYRESSAHINDLADVNLIKSLFERCGRNLRELTLGNWSPQLVLPFIRMAPNVQHLKLRYIKLKSQHFRELARLLPNLKSLSLVVSIPENSYDDYRMGFVKYFKVMSSLEYLSLNMDNVYPLFVRYSFFWFPPNLKYLALSGGIKKEYISILPWVAKGCKHLQGLRLNESRLNENAIQAIFQIKSLRYLDMPFLCGSTYTFETLTELRAVKIKNPNNTVLTVITQHCKELEHITILGYPVVERLSDRYDEHANLLRVVSLPNICSLSIEPVNCSRIKATELINRLIANGKLQYIKMERSYDHSPLKSEVLFKLLRQCKSIRSIALNFGPINSKFYTKICQVVDEIDEKERQQSAFDTVTHQIVELQYDKKITNSKIGKDKVLQYKWLRFTDQISPPAVYAKWRFGFLEAGKP